MQSGLYTMYAFGFQAFWVIFFRRLVLIYVLSLSEIFMSDSENELMGCGDEAGADAGEQQIPAKAESDVDGDEEERRPIGKGGKFKRGRPTGSKAVKGVKKPNLKSNPDEKIAKTDKSTKSGVKTCSDCGKEKGCTEFQPDQALCTEPCLRRKKNIYNACKAQGMAEWFTEQYKDKKKWAKVKAWYSKNCAVHSGGKRAPKFNTMQYKSWVRNEQQRLRDVDFWVVAGRLYRSPM